MNNLVMRVILWFVSIPALVILIYFLPANRHLVFNLMVITISAVGTLEVARFFTRKAAGYRVSKYFVPVIGALLPTLALLQVLDVVSPDSTIIALFAFSAAVLATQVFRKTETEFQYILPVASANLMLILYPGLFFSFVVLLSSLPDATYVLLVFICSVFFNDTMAYIVGNVFGKSSRSILPVSPNKSVVGFAGGFVMSPLVVLVAQALRPSLFPGTVWKRLLFGSVIGIVVILGDLIESALKRSATMKDSGQIIPGRGGVLDSADSAIFAAPFFYYLYHILFT